MKASLRVLVLVHPQFRPDRTQSKSATEFDVWTTLRKLGHFVEIAAVESDLYRFDRQLQKFRPDIVFNLLEEFRGEGIFDFHLVTYLESLGIPYTGCNPRALILTRHKLWTAQLSPSWGVRVPESRLLGRGTAPRKFPVFIKFNREHASLGVTQANVIHTAAQWRKEVGRLRQLYAGELIEQEFIAGLELSVAVWGSRRVESLVPWSLHLPSPNSVASRRIKFSAKHRRHSGIRAQRYAGAEAKVLGQKAQALFRGLDMSGYARFDFRLDSTGTAFLIDVNANPNLAQDEDFARSAKARGYPYSEVISRILKFGLEYEPRL